MFCVSLSLKKYEKISYVALRTVRQKISDLLFKLFEKSGDQLILNHQRPHDTISSRYLSRNIVLL